MVFDDHFVNVDAFADSAHEAVLVLGGTNFMGRALVARLLERPSRVVVVNRGRKHWGTRDPSEGRVTRILADRDDAQAFSGRIDRFTSHFGVRWAAVADFSAFNRADAQASLFGLKGRFELYVYISSDSVYEVSELASAAWQWPGEQSESVSEAMMRRPEDPSEVRRLRRADDYGHGKLEVEEALQNVGRVVSLRLPDVIGPYDGTHRLWAYWLWLRAGDICPVDVAQRKRQRGDIIHDPPLCFVLSDDVARFICNLIGSPAPSGVPECDAVNMGCLTQPTLPGLLSLLAEAGGIESVTSSSAKPKSFLPSVDRPWPLRLQKLTETYGFVPTSLETALRLCVDFFREAERQFPEEASRAAQKLPAAARDHMLRCMALPKFTSSSDSSSSSGSNESSSS